MDFLSGLADVDFRFPDPWSSAAWLQRAGPEVGACSGNVPDLPFPRFGMQWAINVSALAAVVCGVSSRGGTLDGPVELMLRLLFLRLQRRRRLAAACRH